MLFKLTDLAGDSDAITTSPAYKAELSARLGGLAFLTSSTQPCPGAGNFLKRGLLKLPDSHSMQERVRGCLPVAPEHPEEARS